MIFRRTNFLLFFVLTLFFSPFIYAEDDQCELALSDASIESLTNAVDSGGYKVQILQGEIEGQQRIVVLLGESHVKDKEESDLGKNVLNSFNAYGYEGAEIGKTIGGKAFSIVLDVINKLAKVISFGKVSKGSTVNDALFNAEISNKIKKFQEIIDEHGFLEMSEEEQKGVTITYNNIKMTVPQFLEVYEGLKKLIKTEDKSQESSQTDANAQDEMEEDENETEELVEKKVFHLEEGHKPAFAEHVASIIFPASMGFLGYIVLRPLFNLGTSAVAQDGNVTQNTSVFFITLGFTAVTLKVMFDIQKNKKLSWLSNAMDYLNPLSLFIDYGLVHGRNKTMISNTVKAFKENNDVPILLNIVGANHVKGMAKLLKKHHGFKEIPLKAN